MFDKDGNLTVRQEWKDGIAVIDTSDQNNEPLDIKIDGYEVKPILVDPNLD